VIHYDVKTALLGGIIDYAGTFPPAALSLEKALQRAATFRRGAKHPWLVGRVALPLDDLKKLSPKSLYEAGSDGSPWIFTALGRPVNSGDHAEFMRCIEWDIREIRRCQERWDGGSLRMEIVGYETKVPPSVGPTELDAFLSPGLERWASLATSEIIPYFEMAWEGDWEARLNGLTLYLSRWVEEHEEAKVRPALKIRTGGTFTPNAFQLATVISQTLSHGLKFKATQGLHSCLSHDKDLGFVNLMLALAFAQSLGTEGFRVKDIEACLMLTDPKELKWEKNGVTWGRYHIECEAIEAARRRHGGCFGSCSADEPDASLVKLFSEEK